MEGAIFMGYVPNGRIARLNRSLANGLWEKQIKSDGIVVTQQLPNKDLDFDTENLSPDFIAIRWNTPPPGFKLRDESVVFHSNSAGQLSLRKVSPLTQRTQPLSRLLTETLHIMCGPVLGVTIHAALLKRKIQRNELNQ